MLHTTVSRGRGPLVTGNVSQRLPSPGEKVFLCSRAKDLVLAAEANSQVFGTFWKSFPQIKVKKEVISTRKLQSGKGSVKISKYTCAFVNSLPGWSHTHHRMVLVGKVPLRSLSPTIL